MAWIQFLPLILILAVSLLSSLSSLFYSPPYSFRPNQSYPIKRNTAVGKVDYYVK